MIRFVVQREHRFRRFTPTGEVTVESWFQNVTVFDSPEAYGAFRPGDAALGSAVRQLVARGKVTLQVREGSEARCEFTLHDARHPTLAEGSTLEEAVDRAMRRSS